MLQVSKLMREPRGIWCASSESGLWDERGVPREYLAGEIIDLGARLGLTCALLHPRYRIDSITLYAIPAEGPHGFHSLGRYASSLTSAMGEPPDF